MIKRDRAADEPEAQAVNYQDLLATLAAHVAPPLLAELRRREERRALHLFHLVTTYRVIFEGLSALREAFLWLARVPGLHPEISHLLVEAADRIVAGVEDLLGEANPRVLDASRFLMEVEFLFREFARTPDQLVAWMEAEPHQRNQRFGFGQLRQREERARGVPEGQVLPDYGEYRAHSVAVHPLPAGAAVGGAIDQTSGLFYDTGDLLQHAVRVWLVALDAAAATTLDDGLPFDEPTPDLDTVDAAVARIDETMQLLGVDTRREEHVSIRRSFAESARKLGLGNNEPPRSDGLMTDSADGESL